MGCLPLTVIFKPASMTFKHRPGAFLPARSDFTTGKRRPIRAMSGTQLVQMEAHVPQCVKVFSEARCVPCWSVDRYLTDRYRYLTEIYRFLTDL